MFQKSFNQSVKVISVIDVKSGSHIAGGNVKNSFNKVFSVGVVDERIDEIVHDWVGNNRVVGLVNIDVSFLLNENFGLGLLKNWNLSVVSVEEDGKDMSVVGTSREVILVFEGGFCVGEVSVDLLSLENKSLKSESGIDSLVPVVADLLEESSDFDESLVAVIDGVVVVLGGDFVLDDSLGDLSVEKVIEGGFNGSDELVSVLVAAGFAGDNSVVSDGLEESFDELPEVSQEVSIVFSDDIEFFNLVDIFNEEIEGELFEFWSSL